MGDDRNALGVHSPATYGGIAEVVHNDTSGAALVSPAGMCAPPDVVPARACALHSVSARDGHHAPDVVRRAVRAADLRAAGHAFRAIGGALGVTREGAMKLARLGFALAGAAAPKLYAGRKPSTAGLERRARACGLRAAGLSWSAVGVALGVSPTSARRLARLARGGRS